MTEFKTWIYCIAVTYNGKSDYNLDNNIDSSISFTPKKWHFEPKTKRDMFKERWLKWTGININYCIVYDEIELLSIT